MPTCSVPGSFKQRWSNTWVLRAWCWNLADMGRVSEKRFRCLVQDGITERKVAFTDYNWALLRGLHHTDDTLGQRRSAVHHASFPFLGPICTTWVASFIQPSTGCLEATIWGFISSGSAPVFHLAAFCFLTTLLCFGNTGSVIPLPGAETATSKSRWHPQFTWNGSSLLLF